MLRSLSFAGSDRNSRPGTPIQRLWRYLSTTEISGYRSEQSLPFAQIVDDGHPLGLGNPKILRQILGHMDTKTLISLRRVSLRWNHVSCEILRRNMAPVCIRPSQIKKFLRFMKRCFCNPFGSYAIRIENLGELSNRNFFKRFSLDVIKLRVKIASDEIPEFFNRVLKGLTNLEELHLIRIPEGALYLRTAYVPPSVWVYGIFHFPKLKSIIFENDDPTIPFHRNYDAILSQVLNSAPNLVRVTFVSWDSHFSRVISRCGISNPKSFDGWSFSKCNPKLKEDLVELFYEDKMKFKALKFEIDKTGSPSSLDFDLVMDLILQTGDHLYHLALRSDDATQEFLCSFKLRRLITLSLQGWLGPVHLIGMGHQFPNLKSLKVNPSNFSGHDFSKNPRLELPTVETLTVMPLDGVELNPVDANLMENLVKIFPCVKNLHVQVDGIEPLHVVYTHWSRLTRLWVDVRGSGGEGGDEAFTGIPPEVVKILGYWECGCSRLSFPEEARRPTHIGKLGELRELIIRAGNLTDATLLEGISQLKQLQVLWLLPSFSQLRNNSDSNSDEIPAHETPKPWCLRAIVDCLEKLTHLVTSSEIVYPPQDVDYLRAKKPELVHEFKI
ncbi:uncharacterized protein LOC110853427 isoform X1 [Folsomia candida]|uniref:uncharacterized protein LOC110853427 isoform X1 n=1 Tax=Folsomia candida TaxID=158441 RepID=UPI001604C40A|nr:uncharacterized protein LOC110853427 isoform X1 [Folsomia candida]